jgi:hypothetical protein
MANIKSKLKLTKDKILGENHKNVVGLSRLLLSDWEFIPRLLLSDWEFIPRLSLSDWEFIPRLNLTKWVNVG